MDFSTDPRLPTIADWLGSASINLFGLPFAGKDTHGHELAAFFNAPMISGGDIIRNSVVPKHVIAMHDAGILPPSEDYIRIVSPYLGRDEFKGRPLILSSVGRWIGEEQGVIQALEANDHPLKAVIYLNIDEATMRERWQKSQQKQDRADRADDAEHVLDTRLSEFRTKTLPVIEAYRQQGLLIELDTRIPQTEVTEQILAMLYAQASKS